MEFVFDVTYDVEMTHLGDWILPAGIPFAVLKGRDLEECAYWLLDAMGARDLEWRIGGTGGGAPDGGRDLEATFYVSTPDGEMEPQHWWIECKGRKGTVEADEVRAAVNTSLAQDDLDHLVIVTNTTFSNPTRDWVKQWQAKHPRPRVKLWDHSNLERLLSQHPQVVLRLFSEALSAEGLLKAVNQRFWERVEYVPLKALQSFWNEHDTIDIDAPARLALIANEFAHGSIAERPWAARATRLQVLNTLYNSVRNLGYLYLRSEKAGVDQTPIVASLAHLVLAALRHTSAEELAHILHEDCFVLDGEKLPDEVVEHLLMPVLDRLASEMQDVCSSDCERIITTEPAVLVGEENPVASYWRRLEPAGGPSRDDPREILRIERHDAPCKVGFLVDRDHSCPLFEIGVTSANIAEFLAIIDRVVGYRFPEARERYRREDRSHAERKARLAEKERLKVG